MTQICTELLILTKLDWKYHQLRWQRADYDGVFRKGRQDIGRNPTRH